MNIAEHLFQTAVYFPDNVALVADDTRMTYRQLAHAAANASVHLAERGVTRGDRVALMLPNSPEFVIWYFAALRMGGIVVSVSTRLTPTEAAFIATDCDAKLLIAEQEVSSSDAQRSVFQKRCEVFVPPKIEDSGSVELQELSQTVTPTVREAPAQILYTSGTTGFPKGATLSHANVRATVHAFNHLCGMTSRDRVLCHVPLFHCYGQNALLNSAFRMGACVVLQKALDVRETRRLLQEERISKLFGVPTTFQLIADACTPEDLASVEYCFSAATTLPIDVAERWQQKFGMPIYEGYGLTETAPFASYNHELQFEPGSIGSPVDLVEMKVVDPKTGEECERGELGEIVICGPNVMLGYWNRPEETARAIRDGWFHSGDIGRQDDRGYFFIVDRVKDMISVGGIKVFPAEVERVLREHEAVADVAVVGLADAMLSERVVAFVVTKPDVLIQPEELREWSRDRMAGYKVPAHVIFREELPRNPAGKVLKRELRALELGTLLDNRIEQPTAESKLAENELMMPLAGLLAKTHPTQHRDTVLKLLQDEVRAVHGTGDSPRETDRLLEFGLDSLMMLELRERVQTHLGSSVELPATVIFDYPTLGEFSDYVLDLVNNPESRSRNDRDGQTSVQNVTTNDRELDAIRTMSDDEVLDELLRELDD